MVNSVLLLKNKTTPRDPYQEVFSSKSITPQFLPLLEHSPVDKEGLREYLISDEFLNQTNTFIVTSQRAVEVFNECIQDCGEEISKSIWKKVGYTVGPATSKILMESGFKNIRGGHDAGNGAILSDIIIDDYKENGIDKEAEHPIMFFTGEIRRDIIPKKLLSAGIKFKEKVVYKTASRDDIIDNFDQLKHMQQDPHHWIVFFSPQGTEVIIDHILANGGSQSFNIASIGPTTKEYLENKGITPKVVAEKPEANSLLEAITQHEF